jgi:hypothetical protein
MHLFICLAYRKSTGHANILISNSCDAKAKSIPHPFQPLLLRHPAHSPALLLHHPAPPLARAARSGVAGAHPTVEEGEKGRMLASLLLCVPCSSVSPVPSPRCRRQAEREKERGRPRSPAGGGRAWGRRSTTEGRRIDLRRRRIDLHCYRLELIRRRFEFRRCRIEIYRRRIDLLRRAQLEVKAMSRPSSAPRTSSMLRVDVNVDGVAPAHRRLLRPPSSPRGGRGAAPTSGSHAEFCESVDSTLMRANGGC